MWVRLAPRSAPAQRMKKAGFFIKSVKIPKACHDRPTLSAVRPKSFADVNICNRKNERTLTDLKKKYL
jgi:hypothetical protein